MSQNESQSTLYSSFGGGGGGGGGGERGGGGKGALPILLGCWGSLTPAMSASTQ